MTRVFSLSLDVSADLTVEDLWPDGDAPENPTEEDVRQLIKDCGGTLGVIRNWNLVTYDDEFEVRELKPWGNREQREERE